MMIFSTQARLCRPGGKPWGAKTEGQKRGGRMKTQTNHSQWGAKTEGQDETKKNQKKPLWKMMKPKKTTKNQKRP